MQPIDYLCIGHVCHDVVPHGYVLGGTASYSSLVAKSLGRRTGILTSIGEDFQFLEKLESKGIQVQAEMAKHSTTFENIYTDTGRLQYMHSRANTITSIPDSWAYTSIVHLCLIADEISDDFCSQLSDKSLIGLAIQGGLRATDDDKLIITKWPDLQKYNGVDIVFMSDDDIRGLDGIDDALSEIIPIVVITHGKHGATIIQDGISQFFPSYPTNEVDPTGAGDVFGAAFLIAYEHHADVKSASAFAHAAASLSVEGTGVQAIPNLNQVLERQKDYLENILT